MTSTISGTRVPRAGRRATDVLRLCASAVLVLLVVSPLAAVRAQDDGYSADRVKAAFLYHFSTYVNWPESATSDDDFSIAVLGARAVAEELEEFLPGHTIQGRPMEVHRLHSIRDLDDDEVLYIGPSENARLAALLKSIKSRPMLIVTDDPEGLREGAMINFRIMDDRVRFEISLRAAQAAGLEMSSRLLSAAMSVEAAGAIVEPGENTVASDHHAAAR